MNISELCYELYKIDWERRISAERKMDNVKNWYEENKQYNNYTYEEYLFDEGYSGELYVCYNEFLGAEYLDEEYIKGILDNDKLFKEYKKDIK